MLASVLAVGMLVSVQWSSHIKMWAALWGRISVAYPARPSVCLSVRPVTTVDWRQFVLSFAISGPITLVNVSNCAVDIRKYWRKRPGSPELDGDMHRVPVACAQHRASNTFFHVSFYTVVGLFLSLRFQFLLLRTNTWQRLPSWLFTLICM